MTGAHVIHDVKRVEMRYSDLSWTLSHSSDFGRHPPSSARDIVRHGFSIKSSKSQEDGPGSKSGVCDSDEHRELGIRWCVSRCPSKLSQGTHHEGQ